MLELLGYKLLNDKCFLSSSEFCFKHNKLLEEEECHDHKTEEWVCKGRVYFLTENWKWREMMLITVFVHCILTRSQSTLVLCLINFIHLLATLLFIIG